MNEVILAVIDITIFFAGMTYAAKKGQVQMENERIEAYIAGVLAGMFMLLTFFYLA